MWTKFLGYRKPWGRYFFLIILLHLTGAVACWQVASQYPAFLGLCLIAYTLGLRHAFDADHIALIDNTVRKLVHQKQDAHGVGFYFSLGHCTIVFIFVVLTALSTRWAVRELAWFNQYGSVLGGVVSGTFLLIMGLINLVILIQLMKHVKFARAGHYDVQQYELLLHRRGIKARLWRPVLALIQKSWHAYPLGFLFALGFDTAMEISLLVVSLEASQPDISLLGILVLPLLFTAGMSMMDTADGMWMTRTYTWALAKPLQQLYFNVVVSGVTVVAALGIAVVIWSQLIQAKWNLSYAWWGWISSLNLEWVGFGLVGIFFLTWAVAYQIGKYRKRKSNSNRKMES
jgi:high-affinity nickel-transport protein